VRALLPQAAASIDIADAYAIPVHVGDDRPFVRCNMISSLDGAIAVNGRSGLLGGPADGRVFETLRSLADVILVGAGTARAEGYGPVRLSDELRHRRRLRGMSAVPPIAVVTRSVDLDWSSALFREAEARTIVITTSDSDKGAMRRGEKVADFVIAGDARVDPRLAIDQLHRTGYHSVLLEGGPGLNADVVHAGLLDELCLTLSPRLVAGSGSRVLAGPELSDPLELEIVHLLEADGFFFYRLAVPPPATPVP
jgi:riboflavin biosynthesis pyrimidine reductase